MRLAGAAAHLRLQHDARAWVESEPPLAHVVAALGVRLDGVKGAARERERALYHADRGEARLELGARQPFSD